MSFNEVLNNNIKGKISLFTPEEIRKQLPTTREIADFVLSSRNQICDILDGKDKRVVLVIGPCSIHDTDLAREFAVKLADLQEKVKDKFLVVMRVYFEKPRTTVGWKGLINDPYLDDTFKIEDGLWIARKLLLDIAKMGIPTATEALDPVTPQYLNDLISWTAIGARTTESQTHREMSSGLSTPVGFKNATNGDISIAINALLATREPHNFLGIDKKGKCTVFETTGNRYAHVVLRGGNKPNYDEESVKSCSEKLKEKGLITNVMVDCSHGNSGKDYKKQPEVFSDCISQIVKGDSPIMGLMLESNINEGSQKFSGDKSSLEYGVSITDSCTSFEVAEKLILEAFNKL